MTLAELVIKMSADTATLRTDFDKAKSYAQQFSRDVSEIFAAIGTALPGLSWAGMIKEVFDLAEASATLGEQFYKMEHITGLAADELSGLRAISGESSESFETLASTLARAGKNIEEGFIDRASMAGKLLGALFTPAQEASLKLEPVSQRLQDVTQKIFGLTDASDRDFAAATIFGKGWIENEETLRKLAAGFDPAIQKAKELGIALDESAVLDAHLYQEAAKQLGLSGKGFGEDIGQLFQKEIGSAYGLLVNYAHDLGESGMGMPDTGIFPPLSGPSAPQAKLHVHPLLKDSGPHKSLASLMTPPDPEIARRLKEINAEISGLQHNLESLTDGRSTEAIDKLKELGASPAQLSKATGILEQIDDYKFLTDALKGFNEADKTAQEYSREWEGTLKPLERVMQDFYDRTNKLAELTGKLGGNFSALSIESNNLLSSQISKLAEPLLERQSMQFNAGLVNRIGAGVSTKALSDVHNGFLEVENDAYLFGEKASEAFGKLIMGGKKWRDELKDILDDLVQVILKQEVFNNLANVFDNKSGAGSGLDGILGSLFRGLAGGRAGGGSVNNGSAYLVGESGPEIFTPTTSGSIIPNDALTGGGSSKGMTINVDARGADAGAEYKAARGAQAGIRQAAVNGYQLTREMNLRGAQ